MTFISSFQETSLLHSPNHSIGDRVQPSKVFREQSRHTFPPTIIVEFIFILLDIRLSSLRALSSWMSRSWEWTSSTSLGITIGRGEWTFIAANWLSSGSDFFELWLLHFPVISYLTLSGMKFLFRVIFDHHEWATKLISLDNE